MSARCALEGCENAKVKGSRWCDRHRKPANRPAVPALKPGAEPLTKGPAAPPERPQGRVEHEVKEDARRAAKRAMQRLVANIDVGPPSSQIAAARAVLGIAGVQLQPEANVKHVHEAKALPPGVSVADLVALVRGLASPQAPPQVVVDVTPRPQGAVGPMAIRALPAAVTPAPAEPPADPPNGADWLSSGEIIEVFSYDGPVPAPDSGSTPDGPARPEEA